MKIDALKTINILLLASIATANCPLTALDNDPTTLSTKNSIYYTRYASPRINKKVYRGISKTISESRLSHFHMNITFDLFSQTVGSDLVVSLNPKTRLSDIKESLSILFSQGVGYRPAYRPGLDTSIKLQNNIFELEFYPSSLLLLSGFVPNTDFFLSPIFFTDNIVNTEKDFWLKNNWDYLTGRNCLSVSGVRTFNDPRVEKGERIFSFKALILDSNYLVRIFDNIVFRFRGLVLLRAFIVIDRRSQLKIVLNNLSEIFKIDFTLYLI